MSKMLKYTSSAAVLSAVLVMGLIAVANSAIASSPTGGQGRAVPISSIPHDGDYLPTKRIQPKYPRSAFEAGIEGSVILDFTVAKDGTVPADSIKIVKASPEGVFETVATNAAQQFVYDPIIVDGHASAVSGVRYKFAFYLNK